MTPNARHEPVPAARDFDRARTLAVLLTLAAALLAATPRAFAASSACEARAVRGHEVLLAPSLTDWEPVDDRTVLIWTKHSSRASLVRLARPLAGLMSAAVITLVDGDGDRMISPCGRDALTLGYAESERVRIVSIQRLSERRTEALDRDGQVESTALSSI